ncbi:MAG: hypothetical protein HYY16_17760 [Planctomycetes bacterium]|nr:hypothetical protein [Planctomycetota bacterium]
MRRSLALSVAFVMVFGFFSLSSSAVLTIVPEKPLTVLNDAERAELFEWLLQFHSPDYATRVVEQAIVVDRMDGQGRVNLNISEEVPGEILRELCCIGYENHLVKGVMDTIAGDGWFQGEAADRGALSYGTVLQFRGTQSLTDPLRLKLALDYEQIH